MRRSKCVILLLLLASVVAPLRSQASSTPAGASRFVQNFYDWYAPPDAKGGDKTIETAVTTRAAAFDVSLLKALRADIAAQAKSPDEIVGMDFDPVLAAQDRRDAYRAGPAACRRQACRVPVYGFQDGGWRATPEVTAVVVRRGERWAFLDFIYPQGSTGAGARLPSYRLSSYLRTLARQRPGTRHRQS